ncbi:sugar MFS transporter [Haloarcula sp. JP-L23]|uniref:MFS transporter n=1 Tax=Haloarcula sp. JP-L23 TaxID=2716717 RepID=UPI00140EEEFF|nr:MFS transporter [Haloarcula sp. JP-L23]
MDRSRAWTLAVFIFIFGDAAAMQARGPILSSVGTVFNISEAALGLVAPAGTVGFLGAVVVTGLFAGRLQMRRMLAVGTTLTGIALVLAAVSPLYVVFLTALVLQGTAAGVFRGLDRVVLSHLYPDNRGKMYAAYTLVWAFGAVLSPQLVSLVLSVSDWRMVFLVLTCVFLPVIVIVGRYELPSMDAERSVSRAELSALLKRPAVVGACVGMVLVGALEGTLFTWLVYYSQTFYDTAIANLLLSVYLLAYIPGRLGCTVAVDYVSYLTILLVVYLPAAPALAIAFSGVTGPLLFAAIFVAGFAVSSGFPVLSGYAVEAAPEYSGPLNAVTNGATYVGLATAPAVVGVLAESVGIRQALWSTVPVSIVFIITIGGLWLWTGSADPPTHQRMADSQ